ncbi:carbohydrate ABC transporter, N-acetylglucosamine/diacetylchitobiose-binding protein [Kribbella sandramycini]|uniref:Carbohydrate ABC transporter, N-acetylglucosamine/diacetylchitobiose-binding protein n=1 Tax=Kribbella sandramycini TaxID=60450 RepID=A0A7Y4P1A5_9ACTN|nr:N-acetylglucosamine/diacetylchitobiose ABC transporter substrate-binding protein [Kribbella sandramycini]MBB6565682.1 N-acetylglucosamine transport system substrate-binding protein [Kribbella sandramycini]NOL41945.1 carbohydrate ABC transporter, N-acetylglucosamine/diacetylchitobiose-binding protein [Kribbella sandramycini]
MSTDGKVDRRTLLRVALAAPAVAGLASCAKPVADKANPVASGAAKLDGGKPLEFFNFDGGYGKKWTELPLDLYRKAYPQADVKLTSGQQLQQQLQPRFIQGNPPDLIENVGLDGAALAGKKQLLDIGALLEMEAFDQPGVKVKDTLLPGVAEAGRYDGVKYEMPYVFGVGGIWYSQALLTKHGWEYPKTWPEMLALCAEIKKAGIAPWTYQGKFPGYLTNPLLMTAYKAAGPDLKKNLDNLQPNAWRDPALVQAAEGYQELAAKGYLLEGTQALSHTLSQNYWAQGKAVFIPCGGWLENELGDAVPKNFEMTMAPVPGWSASDKAPFETVTGGPGGALIVPAQAKNPQGGLELLRIIVSKQCMKNFAELTNSPVVTKGAVDDVKLTPAAASMQKAIAAAGTNMFSDFQFRIWYKKLLDNSDKATSALMNRELTPEEWSKQMQKYADETAKDPSIKKFSA